MRRFTENSLLVATHNAGKLEEIRDLLSAYPLSVTGAAEHGLPEPEETGTTFVENARIKAQAAVAATGLPALADDSGIEIDALNGAPGVYTADWAETPNGRDFIMAMTKTYEALCDSGIAAPWTARFCCTFVLAWPDGHDEVFEGRMEGQISWPIRGELGHGYDPIFMPRGYDITCGEMPLEVKNRISHRADAFRKLRVVFEDG